MKTILVPVDFSPATTRVCAAACALAKLVHARVVLLHVVVPLPAMMGDAYIFDTGHMAQAMAVLERQSAKKLRALGRRYHSRPCPVQTSQRRGEPAPSALAIAAELKATYIVIGSHGHGAAYDLLVGSTTQGVLRKARCPVLVVPQHRR